MTTSEIAGIAPFFIVRNVPAALTFYRDRLGFDITFQGPEPDDIFFRIVQRGGTTIILKAIGVEPVPNYTRDINQVLTHALSIDDDRIGLKFDEPVRIDETRHLHDRVGGANRTEEFPVHGCDGLPVVDASQQGPRADDVIERRSGPLERFFDDLEAAPRLRSRIALADRLAVEQWCGARHGDD